MHVCTHMYVSVYVLMSASGVQRRVLDALGSELQVTVTSLTWVLLSKLRSSVRTVCFLNH